MAYKSNRSEIPVMIEKSFGEWGASRHEIRYTYNVRHINDAFREEHFLSRADWAEWAQTLARDQDKRIEIAPPPADYEKAYDLSVKYWVVPAANCFTPTLPEHTLAL